MRKSTAFLVMAMTLVAAAAWVRADSAARPGFGLAYFENGHPVSPAPTGFNPGDWEWRPLYVSHNGAFKMPVQPTLVGKPNYWFSASAWKSRLSTTCPWTTAGLFLRNRGPSSCWRRYQSTLYYQINNVPIPDPAAMAGYPVGQYYYNRYAATDTIPSQALPSNWYLDPFRRMVVESVMNSYDELGSWGLYDDMATLFEDCAGEAGATMGAGGTFLYLLFLACEYALIISYDDMVQTLEQQAAIHRSYFAAAEHNYFSVFDPAQGRDIIVQRKVPNYSVPGGVDSAVAPTRNCVGTFSFSSGQAASTPFADDAKTKSVVLNETFTTATVPFQFSLEAEDPAAASNGGNSRLGGRFTVRVHAPAGGSQPERWFSCEVVGTSAGQWLSPWAFVSQKDNQSSWNSQTDGTGPAGDNPTHVPTSFATGGQNIVSLNWSGELIIRAMDLGVDRLDKLELTTAAEARGGLKCTARVCVQPVFSRNIAEAGPWRTAVVGAAVNFTAETSALPSNAQSTSYTWTFPDGGTATGQSVSHTFTQPGIYDVVLKTDPQVPTQAPNKDLFNDTSRGFSYDICRVSVGGGSAAVGSSDAAVTFSDVVFTASASSITATWKTNPATTSRLEWSVLPPDFVGPPAPNQAGVVTDGASVTNHQLVLTGRSPGTTYYLRVGGTKAGSTTIIYAKQSGSTTWTVVTPATGQPNNVVTPPGGGLVFTNLRFDASPGKIVASWNTDQPATARVQWATSATATPSQQVSSPTAGTAHQLTLSGLTNGTTYYLTVSATPQGSSTPVVCKRNGTSSWDVKVPLPYTGGSRASDLVTVEYATAIPAGSGQYKYQARLSQVAQVRLVRRPLSSASWTQTAWVSNTRDPNWTLATQANEAYEFAIEQQDDGRVVRCGSWIHVAGAPPPPPPPPTTGGRSIVAFTCNAADGQTVTFPCAFASPPVIVLSAARGDQPLAACAVNNSKTGFVLSLRDPNDQAVTQAATVCCLAFVPGSGGLQGGVAQYGDNASINFSQGFAAPPVIVCNAQNNGRALLAAAVNNRANGFTLRLRNLNGTSVGRAWVQWVAAQPPIKTKLGGGRLVVQGAVLQAGDGVACTYPQMPGPPVVIGSAQWGSNAYLVGPRKRSVSRTDLSIRGHDNQPAGNVWLQWLALFAD